MDSLMDLISLLDKRTDGMTFGDLKIHFDDQGDLKNFIKIGLDDGSIKKEGERRGTKYFSTGSSGKIIDDDDNITYSYDLEQYLKSDKPITGEAAVTKSYVFGPYSKENDKLTHFLNSGMCHESYLIGYDKHKKKNAILHEDKQSKYNTLSLKYEDRFFIITKYNAEKYKYEYIRFKSYDDFREKLRSMLKGFNNDNSD